MEMSIRFKILIIILVFLLFNGCKQETSDNKNTVDTTKKSTKTKINNLKGKVNIEITGKDFQHGDPKDPADAKDYNVIVYKMTNNTGKEIRQVEADVSINDLASKEIKKVSISYIEGIPVKDSREYKGLYNFNAFNDKDAALKSTDLKNIKYDIDLVSITYRDGTVEMEGYN